MLLLASHPPICWLGMGGLSGTAIDCLSLVACPFLSCPLYCCTTPKPPFPMFLQRSSTSMAGRYADNFPSGLCRITLNLFFLLLSTSLDQSPLCCNVSCRIVSYLPFRGLSCPITIPLCTTPRAATVFHSSSSVRATTTITIVTSSINHRLRLRLLPHALFFFFLL